MDTREEKVVKPKALGATRRAETFVGYARKYPKIGDYHDGKYETEGVSPITKSADNVDSPLFLVLHDWWADRGAWPISGAFDARSAARGYGTTPSDAPLLTLLHETYGKGYGDVFITNLWPFVKPRDGDPPLSDYDRAFGDYCWPLIEIIAPQLVICAGKPVRDTFARCLRGPYGAVGTHFPVGEVTVWYQDHPSARPVNATQGEMLSAWAQMKAAVDLQWSAADVNPPARRHEAVRHVPMRAGEATNPAAISKPRTIPTLEAKTPTLGVCVVCRHLVSVGKLGRPYPMPEGWWGECRRHWTSLEMSLRKPNPGRYGTVAEWEAFGIKVGQIA